MFVFAYVHVIVIQLFNVVMVINSPPVVTTETTAKPSERPSSPPPHPVADEESLIAEAQESLEKSFEFLDNQDDSDSDSGKLCTAIASNYFILYYLILNMYS